MSRPVRDVESLPHQQSMRAGLKVRKMRRLPRHQHLASVSS